MCKITPSLIIIAVAALGFGAAPAQAQLARTYVSSNGSDANNCDRPTPCRTFQRAHDNTLPSGEITVLDPGGYGAVTIAKNISIINDGVGEAGVLVSGGAAGITINAASTDAVSLRGLTVKGIGFGGGNGIVFNSGKSVSVENCAIRNLTGSDPIGYGIKFVPAGLGSLSVSHTLVADNGAAGILANTNGSGDTAQVLLNRVALSNNYDGLVLNLAVLGTGLGTVKATVKDSVVTGNSNANNKGIVAVASASLMLIRSVIANNYTGIFGNSGGAARIRIGRSTVTGNVSTWQLYGTVLQSYGDNRIDGNGDSPPAPTKIPTK
jgi:hypothetical protein